MSEQRGMHFHGLDDTLSVEDCRRFELLFGAVVRRLLDCEAVAFLVRQTASVASEPGEGEGVPHAWEAGARLVRRRGRPVADVEHGRLFLPLRSGEAMVAVVVAERVPADILAWPEERLAGLAGQIGRECALLRRWAVDPITGLGTGAALVEELDALAWEKRGGASSSPWLTVALLEVVPDTRQGIVAAARQLAGCLRQLLGDDTPLYHFGGGLFAMIWNDVDLRRSFGMANAVLAWIRNRQQGQASLGMETMRLPAASDDVLPSPGRRMVERAIEALDRARRRGPAALCNFSAEDAAGRLAGPPAPVARFLARHWRGRERFAVFALREQGKGRLSRKLLSLVGEPPVTFIDEEREAWGVLPDVDRPEVERFVGRLRQAAREEGFCVLLGAALYPCPGFRKGQIAVNARKALIHASFYGDNGAAIFNDVTCNISGDIYYEDGNLAGAVQEYRHGLRLNPDSVNLNNSLGVCYAQMGFDRRAIPCFRRALEQEPENFMALFNLGLALRRVGRPQEAWDAFVRAHAVDGEHAEVARQLGLLALEAQRYEEAVRYLDQYCAAADRQKDEPAATRRRTIEEGRALCALAEALQGIGDEKRAMSVLERAARVDPANGRALGLLAELYDRHGQGDEIVQALARRAAALDPEHKEHWRRLAQGAAVRQGEPATKEKR